MLENLKSEIRDLLLAATTLARTVTTSLMKNHDQPKEETLPQDVKNLKTLTNLTISREIWEQIPYEWDHVLILESVGDLLGVVITPQCRTYLLKDGQRLYRVLADITDISSFHKEGCPEDHESQEAYIEAVNSIDPSLEKQIFIVDW